MFAVWTVLVSFVDVRGIGPGESVVGFARLNGFVHNLTGVHMWLYTITDWLGFVPICLIMVFGFFGLMQWIRRKNILKVDFDILILGMFYIITMAVYMFFEIVVINYRPVLIGGFLEASYPSSTTMLVMCVMPTAVMQFNSRLKSRVLKKCIGFASGVFVAFMVIGRLISGVHWITDIVGGVLFSAGLVMLYSYFSKRIVD